MTPNVYEAVYEWAPNARRWELRVAHSYSVDNAWDVLNTCPVDPQTGRDAIKELYPFWTWNGPASGRFLVFVRWGFVWMANRGELQWVRGSLESNWCDGPQSCVIPDYCPDIGPGMVRGT